MKYPLKRRLVVGQCSERLEHLSSMVKTHSFISAQEQGAEEVLETRGSNKVD